MYESQPLKNNDVDEDEALHSIPLFISFTEKAGED